MMDPLTAQARRDLYESSRQAWRTLNNIPRTS